MKKLFTTAVSISLALFVSASTLAAGSPGTEQKTQSFLNALEQGGGTPLEKLSVEDARNVTLLMMVLFSNVNVLNSRSESRSIVKRNFISNPMILFGVILAQVLHLSAMYTPGLKEVLQVRPVSFELWFNLLAIALVLILVDELYKNKLRKRNLYT